MKIDFHRSCKTLSIYSLTQSLETGNLLFLLKNYDEFSDDDVVNTEEEKVELSKAFQNILYEYSELTKNRKFILNYLALINIEKEKFKYNCLKKILEFYNDFNDPKIFDLLKELQVPFNSNNKLEKEVANLINIFKRLETKIDLMIVKYDLKYKPKNDADKSKVNLEEEALSLAIILKISYSIDVRTTSVTKWVSMANMAKKINNSTK